MIAYALIASERLNKTLVALGGAVFVVILPVINSDEVFFSRETGIDWDVIFLLLGMMIIVSVVRQTGVFEYVAIWAAKRASGSPLRIMILLMVVSAVASALLDNVTTVLLIAPVTLLVCDRLQISPAPFLMAEAFAANIGGTATLVGDPPNIIIADRGGVSFNAFVTNLAPIAVIMVALAALLPRLFPGAFIVDAERIADVMSLDEREAINDHQLLTKCGVVLVTVFAGFVAHKLIHMKPSLVAMVGAGVLIVISGLTREFYLQSVEWETLLFFSGLFIMVGALVKTGVISQIARLAGQATVGNVLVTTMLVLVVSFVASGVVNNVPYAATMTPIVAELASSIHPHLNSAVLWWALALGTDLGGNLTAVGASANVVVIGIAQCAGHPISFWEFTRKGAIVTAVSAVLCAGYLWLRYLAQTQCRAVKGRGLAKCSNS